MQLLMMTYVNGALQQSEKKGELEKVAKTVKGLKT